MNLDLKGRRALVCGGSSGLGLATAIELSKMGATVTLFARNKEKLKDALNVLDTTQDQEHDFLSADFSDPQTVKAVIEEYIARGNQFQILINNTGGPAAGPVKDAQADDFLTAFRAHVICNQYLVQALLGGMIDGGFGRIVNIISISVKQPIAGLGVSNTVRGAVASWSKTLANELGPKGITVNNVLPGYTRTARFDSLMDKQSKESGKSREDVESQLEETIPLRRIGEPDDFGAVVAFLCSPSAGYISGASIPIDGGRTGCI